MMDEVTFSKGQRVSYTDTAKGITYSGVVDVQRRGWVMINLDTPCETRQGWSASRMMLKAADLSPAADPPDEGKK